MAEIKTRITELFGIKYPILQGGMGAGFVSTPELVAAVGDGGLDQKCREGRPH